MRPQIVKQSLGRHFGVFIISEKTWWNNVYMQMYITIQKSGGFIPCTLPQQQHQQLSPAPMMRSVSKAREEKRWSFSTMKILKPHHQNSAVEAVPVSASSSPPVFLLNITAEPRSASGPCSFSVLSFYVISFQPPWDLCNYLALHSLWFEKKSPFSLHVGGVPHKSWMFMSVCYV